MRYLTLILQLIHCVLLIIATSSTSAQTPEDIVVPDYALLALDNELKNTLDAEVKSLPTKRQRLNRLHDLLYKPYYYHIRYNPEGTLTAMDTFHQGSGNCISLANLFIAAARYVGLRARYQSVRLQPEWRPRDDFYEVPGHINVIVDMGRERATIEFNQAFYQRYGHRRLIRRIISDKQAEAEFYNNIGVEKLAEKNYALALAYFEKALTRDKKLDFVWSNKGVAHKLAQQYGLAEASYLKALGLNPRNNSTISNIYILYQHLGDKNQSEIYAKRAERYARKNPYYLEKLANSEMEAGEYKNAIRLFKMAIKIFDLEPDFFHGLAVAYYYTNDLASARKALQNAKDIAASDEFKARYQRKLNALAALQ